MIGTYRRFIALAVVCLPMALAATPAQALVAPASDPFYTPPANLGHYADGTILHSRHVTLTGSEAGGTATAYQLMFRTTNATGQAVAATTTVMIPSSPAAGPRRLASYQTAYDSLTLNCAPSYTLQGGNSGGGDTATIEQGLIRQELNQGWDVNVPDYEGLQSEWVVGPLIGRAVLDSIRAAEHFTADDLEGVKTEVTLNGYSGGSEASTWAAALAPGYAPELDIVGMAAGGNFPNLDYTLSQFDGSLWYGTEIGVMESFSRAYTQFKLSKLLNAAGLALATSDGMDAGGCGGSTLNEPGGTASKYTLFPSSAALAADPLVVSVLAKASLDNAPPPTTPEYLYNGVGDELAHITPVNTLVAEYCAKGVTLDYDADPLGIEHIEGITRYWPAALVWMEARFAGEPAPDNCPAGSPTHVTPPAPPSCAAAGLHGSRVGVLALGMTKAAIRRAAIACTGIAAVHVGYATATELRTVGSATRRSLRGRAVWLTTASRAYSLRGVDAGMTLVAARRDRKLTLVLVRGADHWYTTTSGAATGLVEVRGGKVLRVGVAARALTRSARARKVLLSTIAKAG